MRMTRERSLSLVLKLFMIFDMMNLGQIAKQTSFKKTSLPFARSRGGTVAISCSSLIWSFATMSFYVSIFSPRLDVALECFFSRIANC